MNRGFYIVMAAQFVSSLADNAMRIAAIALLVDMHSAEAMRPMLNLFFFIPYVVLAPFVGPFADRLPKGRVMFLTNAFKLLGGLFMLAGVHPLFAFAVIGFGAAAYSPAKYGIVTELLPPNRLVAANGWIESLTVGSIVLGSFVGGVLVSTRVSSALVSYVGRHAGMHVARSAAAVVVICTLYAMAALINLRIPDTGVRYARQSFRPAKLIGSFAHSMRTLWTDPLGQISLAVTTLFWGAGACLQLLVIAWSHQALSMGLSRAAVLQSVTAVGVALGAIAAAARVTLRGSYSVLPYGMSMGLVVASVALVDFHHFPAGGITVLGIALGWSTVATIALMTLIGALAGYFVVPMNALLQHRGYVLLSAGNSIAVQNCNENLSILIMSGVYTLLLLLTDVTPAQTMVLFGIFVACVMGLIMIWHRHNQARVDSVSLIGDTHHGGI